MANRHDDAQFPVAGRLAMLLRIGQHPAFRQLYSSSFHFHSVRFLLKAFFFTETNSSYKFPNEEVPLPLSDSTIRNTTISGVPRNSRGVVQIKLGCGLNKLPVENTVTFESSLELIHNCVQADSRLVGLYLNSSWLPLSEVNDDDEVSIAVEVRYQACYEDGEDMCDGTLWWLQVGGDEVAVLPEGGTCESGDVEEAYGQRMCRRKQSTGKSSFITRKDRTLYDGQLIKGKRAKLYSLGTGRSEMIPQRRRKRDTANTCDYTIETTSTSTTTESTTTETTTETTTTTVPTTTSTVTSTTESTSTESTTTTPESTTTETTSTSTESTSTSTESTSTSTESTTTGTTSTSTESTSTSTESTSTSTESTSTSTESTSTSTESTSTSTETTSTDSTSTETTTAESTSTETTSTSTESTTPSSTSTESTTTDSTSTETTSSASTSTETSSTESSTAESTSTESTSTESTSISTSTTEQTSTSEASTSTEASSSTSTETSSTTTEPSSTTESSTTETTSSVSTSTEPTSSTTATTSTEGSSTTESSSTITSTESTSTITETTASSTESTTESTTPTSTTTNTESSSPSSSSSSSAASTTTEATTPSSTTLSTSASTSTAPTSSSSSSSASTSVASTSASSSTVSSSPTSTTVTTSIASTSTSVSSSTASTTKPTTTKPVTTVEPLPANAICSYLDETTTSTTVTTTITSTTTEPTSSSTETSSTTVTTSTSPTTSTVTTTDSSTTLTTSTPSTSTSPSTSPSTSSSTASSTFLSTSPSSSTVVSTSSSTPATTPTTSVSSSSTSQSTTPSTSPTTSLSSSASTSPSTSSSVSSSSSLSSSSSTQSSSTLSSTSPSTSSASSSASPSTTVSTSTSKITSSPVTSTSESTSASSVTSPSASTNSLSGNTTSSEGSSVWVKADNLTALYPDGSVLVIVNSSLSAMDATISFECKNSTSDFATIENVGTCFTSQNTMSMQVFSFNVSSSIFVGPGVYTFRATVVKRDDGEVFTTIFTVTLTSETTTTAVDTTTILTTTTDEESSSVSTSSESTIMTSTQGTSSSTSADGSSSSTSNSDGSTTASTSSSSSSEVTSTSDETSTTTEITASTSDGSLSTDSSSISSSSDSTTSSSESSESSSSSSGSTTTSSDSDGSSTSSSDGSNGESGYSTLSAVETTSAFVYDFILTNLTWEETVEYSDNVNFSITPKPNYEGIYLYTVSYQCRNDSSQPFLPLKESNCLVGEKKKIASFSAQLELFPVAQFIPGTGKYEFIITVSDNQFDTMNATHNFVLNVIPLSSTTEASATSDSISQSDSSDTTDTTGVFGSTDSSSFSDSTDSSDSSGTGSSDSSGGTGVTDSSGDSGGTDSSSDTSNGNGGTTQGTSSSSDGTTGTAYNFTVEGYSWNVTVNYTDGNMNITPVSNTGKYVKVAYLCRNDTSQQFISIKKSNCLTQTDMTSLAAYTGEFLWTFPSPGLYEFIITVTDASDDELTATNNFTVNVLPPTTTTDLSTTTDSASQSDSSDGTGTVTTDPSSGSSGSDGTDSTDASGGSDGTSGTDVTGGSDGTGGTDPTGGTGGTGVTDTSGATGGSDSSGGTGATDSSDSSGDTGGTDSSGRTSGTDSSDSTGGTGETGPTGVTDSSGGTGGTGGTGSSGVTDSTGLTDTSGGSDGSDSSGGTGPTDPYGGTGGTGTTDMSGATVTGDGQSSDDTTGSTTLSSESDGSSGTTSDGSGGSGGTGGTDATGSTDDSSDNGGISGTGGTGLSGSDSSDSTTQPTSTTAKSTRTKSSLSTAAPLTAEELAAIAAQKADVTNQLASIIDGSAASTSLNSSSSLLNQISTLPTADLVEVAQSLLSNTLKISGVGNMSNIDVLTTLKDNIATTNSELAAEMTKVINQLAAVNMTSAESMNSVLSSLDLALKGSTVYTLGVSSTKSTDGTYAVIFGYVLANGYTLVSPRCTLSIYGSTVYLTGDTRASYLQQTGDTFTVNTMLTAMGVQGSFAKNGRTVEVDQDKIEQEVSLVSGYVMDTLSGTGDVQSGEYGYSDMYVTAWNVSYDNTTAGSTTQKNVSVSFWLPVTSVQYSLLIESGTMVKLQSTQSVVSQGLVVTTSYGGVTYTVTCTNGTGKFIEIGTTTAIFSYSANSFTVTASDGSATTTMQKMIQMPIVIENVDLLVFNATTPTSPLSFSAYGSYPLRMVFSPQDTSLPSVSAIAQTVSISTLSPTTSYSQSDLKTLIANQTAISVTGTLIFAKASSIDVSGYTFTADSSAIYLQSTSATIVISDPTYNVVSLSLGGYGIQITAGSYTSGSQSHSTTMMEFSDTQKMRIDGGLIVRNGTNGYVIQNGKVSTEGDVSGTKIDIVPQSLMNQESQQQIATILSNTQTFLENNGMTMTDAQINDTSNSLLSIASSLTSALKTALDNPLSSDLAANLEYATTNYDSLYNVLPSDPNDIVYVEEMSSEEWAAYVTKMVQKSIAKTLANQLASTLDTLENTLAARAIATGNLPYDYSNNVDGTGMVIVIDDASNIVGKTYSCDEWDLTLPSPASTLNNAAITDSTMIQVGMVCYNTNPRTYVDNFDMLITSGALEAHIKDENQNNIEVSGTTSPITIIGRGSDDDAMLTLMQQADFSSYQILDLHAFRTTNWNNSVQIQIVASNDYDIPANDDTYMFSAYQSLPGPLQANHEWQFELNSLNSSTTYYVSASDLVNNTGLFYLGVGKRNETSTGNNSNVVDYGTFDSKQWSFAKSVPMDYQLTAISKGCYYYLNSTDMFNSDGMSPNNEAGMQFVNCSSDHLTLFSLGSFNPTINADFDYNYSINNIEKNVKVMITAIFLLIVYGCLTVNALISDRKDASSGRLRFLSDNEPHDGYMYILAVETGYRMFATTDSTISFNLSGTEGDQIFRSFKAEEDGDWEYPFSWGTTARFLMTTPFPLGQLEYVRLWIDDAGLDHRESWYCNRIIVKDLQTQEICYFPFNNWLGTKNGDGETERLARVDYKRRFLDEAMSMHMLGQTISWFGMFTGGGNRLRDRVKRQDYAVSVIATLVVVSIINIIVLKNENAISTPSANFSEFTFTVKDIVLGVVYAILITFISSLHILLCCKCRSVSEEHYLKKRREEEPGFKDPSGSWSYFVAGIVRAVLPFPMVLGIIFIGGHGMSLMDDFANSFYMRFLISLVAWAIVFEPLKGMIWAYFLLKTSKNHKISNKLEEAFLRVKPAETFMRNPYGKIEKELGTVIADVTKLRDTENRKMRDEQLFVTLRDMLCFFVSLYIMVMLTFYCKDRHAFYYQQEMSTMLNIPQGSYGDNSFMSIRSSDDFWVWSRDSLATALLASWYDGNPAYGMRAFLNDKVSRSMGIGTIRQVRTKKSAQCKIIEQFKNYIDDCGEEITKDNEEKTQYMQTGWTPLDIENGTDSASDEYTYKTEKDLQTGTVAGTLSSYGGGGYTVSLSGTVAEMQTLFNKLENERWIDEFTRAVIIEFSAYNAQINYFSVVQLLVEIPKSGIYLPISWVESVRLIKSEGSSGSAVKYYEMLYIFLSVLLFVKEILYYLYGRYKVITTMKKTRNPFEWVYKMIFGHFTPWNAMDLVVGGLAVGSVIAYVLRQKYTNEAMADFIANNGNSYINLTVQRNTELAFNYCLAGAVFFTSCKMIRILKFNRRIGVLAATLDNALGAIVAFGVALLFFCMTFNSVLYVLLGNKMAGYRSQIATFETTLAGMLGKLDVTSIKPINQFAFVVTMIYMMVASKLVLQLYVTIIMYEFEEIRNDSEKQTNDYEIIDHIRYKTKRRFGLMEPKDFSPVSIADTQKDFRLFHSAVAKVNLLHHRATRLLQTQGQYKNDTVINYTRSYDPVAAIDRNGPKRFEKWRLNDVDRI